MSKVDFEDPLRFLDIVGLKPTKTDKFSKFRKPFFCSLTSTTAILGLSELLFNFKGLETCSRASESMIVIYQVLFKMFVLHTQQQRISELIQDSSKFWPLDRFDVRFQPQSQKVHKIIRLFFQIYKTLMVMMTFQYIFRKLIFKSDLPLAITYGEGEGFSPRTDFFIFVFHATSTIVTLHVICGFDGLFFYFVAHLLSEVKNVKLSFEQGSEDFFVTIRHHQHVLRFVQKLNETYSNLLLHQHVSCLFGICFGLFLLSEDGLPPDFPHLCKYVPYVISFVTQTFTFCFFGSLITDWSSAIPDVVFHNCQSFKLKFERIMTIQRGQRAATLTLGGFGNLNLESFALVIKNSFNFFTFINAIHE